jgi:hypothetical protein
VAGGSLVLSCPSAANTHFSHHSGSSPKKSKTVSNPDKPASGQVALAEDDFADFSADLQALISGLEETDDFRAAVDLAERILCKRTPFECAQRAVVIDCETAVRVLLDCEIMACVMALSETPGYAGLVKGNIQVFIETKQDNAPSKSVIADRLQKWTEGGVEHPDAVPIEAKGPRADPSPLLPTIVSNGKHAHQLRCEMDATRATGDRRNHGPPKKRRQFGVLCDHNFMFLFYTTVGEGRMHGKAIEQHDERGRLSTFLLVILISLRVDRRFFELADDDASTGGGATPPQSEPRPDGGDDDDDNDDEMLEEDEDAADDDAEVFG